MKKIYIVLTYTGTLISKIVKFYTKKTYSHVSIALDENLEDMYSFGRLRPYNAFVAGFVHERLNSGTYKRFKKTKALIFWIEVTDEEYKKIEDTIGDMKLHRTKYKFNLIGLFLVSLHKKRVKKYTFYCAEFVRYVLQNAGIGQNLPEIIKPEDFKMLGTSNIEYEGLLRSYNQNKIMLEKS